MHIGENVYTLYGSFLSNVWNPGPQYLQSLGRAQTLYLKRMTCRSILGDKEYVESLIRNLLLPVSYFLVLKDLVLRNKILLGSTSMKASDHWSITSGCARTRSSEMFLFLKPEILRWNHLTFISRGQAFLLGWTSCFDLSK